MTRHVEHSGPKLLIDWEPTGPIGHRKAGIGSLAIHGVWIFLLIFQSRPSPPSPLYDETPTAGVVRLTMPTSEELSELTQILPGRTSNIEFFGPAEKARPLLVLPDVEPASVTVAGSTLEEKEPGIFESVKPSDQEVSTSSDPISPTTISEKNKPLENHPLRASSSPNPGDLRRGTLRKRLGRPDELPAPRTPLRQKSNPRLTLEDPKAVIPGRTGNLQLGSLKLTARTDEVVRNALHKATNRRLEKSILQDTASGNLQGAYVPPSPGNTGSSMELLSDPGGIDFRPYLTRILTIVRRNWYAVIPESARLGLNRGNVLLQFSISRNGTVPKLVIFHSSGAPELDRAAVAGISASNPFPPLPDDFTGQVVLLQFKFAYNMK